MKNLTTEEYTFIIENSIHTGSRIFGVEKPDSDYDYVIKETDFKTFFLLNTKRMEELLTLPYLNKELYLEGPLNFASFRAMYHKKDINVILIQSEELFKAWGVVTDIFKSLPKDSILLEDKNRGKIFEAFKYIVTKVYMGRGLDRINRNIYKEVQK